MVQRNWVSKPLVRGGETVRRYQVLDVYYAECERLCGASPSLRDLRRALKYEPYHFEVSLHRIQQLVDQLMMEGILERRDGKLIDPLARWKRGTEVDRGVG